MMSGGGVGVTKFMPDELDITFGEGLSDFNSPQPAIIKPVKHRNGMTNQIFKFPLRSPRGDKVKSLQHRFI